MKLTEVAEQILNAAIKNNTSISVKPADFDTKPTILAVSLYDVKRNNEKYSDLSVSRSVDRVCVRHKSKPDLTTAGFSRDNFQAELEKAELSTVKLNDAQLQSATQVIKISAKKKLVDADLDALRQLLNSGVIAAVEIHGFDSEFFAAVFPRHVSSFEIFNKHGFLLLL